MKKLCAAGIGLGLLLLLLTASDEIDDGRKFFGLWQFRHLGLTACLWLAAGAAFAASRSRRALLAYVFSGVLAAFAIVLLEIPGLAGWISYPVLMGNRQGIPTNNLGASPVPHLDVHGQTSMDTATSWGIDHEPIPFHYRTDQRGFRNPEDQDEADVYLLGDSIVVGALVPFEQTMTGLLRERLGRPVMNVALIAVGPEQEHEFFRKAELPLAGRLVLQFVFEGNDLLDTASFRARQAGTEPAPMPLRQRSFAYNLMLVAQRWSQPVVGLARRQSCTIDGQLHTFAWVANSHRGVEDQIAPMLAALAAFAREVETQAGRYAVVFVPSKLRVLRDVCVWPAQTTLGNPEHIGPLRDAILAWGAESGVSVVDLTGALQAAAAAGDTPWFWGDTHWNASGHRIAAEFLYAAPPVRELLGTPGAAPDAAGPPQE